MRYWLTVQAQLNDRSAEGTPFVYWGWRAGDANRAVNNRTLQVSLNGPTSVFNTDGDFAFVDS